MRLAASRKSDLRIKFWYLRDVSGAFILYCNITKDCKSFAEKVVLETWDSQSILGSVGCLIMVACSRITMS